MDKKEKETKAETYKNYIKALPKKRMAAGAIIRDPENRILMVKPSYKSVLEIPGGVVEKDESPFEGCKRELKEELGIVVKIERMLCVGYEKPDEQRTERLIFIFDGGMVTNEILEKIKVDGTEILNFGFMSLEEIKGKTTDSLFKTISMSMKAIENYTTYYLENLTTIKAE